MLLYAQHTSLTGSKLLASCICQHRAYASCRSTCLSAGAVVQSLTNSSLTPLTIIAFTLPLPYLTETSQLSPQLAAGSAVLVAGLAVYNSKKWLPALQAKLNKE